MKASTKHALMQRLLALLGIAVFLAPIFIDTLKSIPIFIQLLGWLIVAFAILSGMGFGPWGRLYTKLYLSEYEESLKKLEPRQPWQNNEE